MRIGLELCDQFTAAALVGQDGIIHRKKQLDSYKNRPSEALLDLTALCRALPEEEGLPWEAVVELGVCSPDFGGNGRLTWPGWEDIPLAERLRGVLGKDGALGEPGLAPCCWPKGYSARPEGTRRR